MNSDCSLRFTIEETPTDVQVLSLAADVEGRLVIASAQSELKLEGILLVELAFFLAHWLRVGGEFNYAAMDMEEQPVLAFIPQTDGTALVRSVLSEESLHVPLDGLTLAAKSYIEQLSEELSANYGIDVAPVIERNLRYLANRRT